MGSQLAGHVPDERVLGRAEAFPAPSDGIGAGTVTALLD
jgi:hypothetical protein